MLGAEDLGAQEVLGHVRVRGGDIHLVEERLVTGSNGLVPQQHREVVHPRQPGARLERVVVEHGDLGMPGEEPHHHRAPGATQLMHQQWPDPGGASAEACVAPVDDQQFVDTACGVGSHGEPELRLEPHRRYLQLPASAAERGRVDQVERAVETGGHPGGLGNGLGGIVDTDHDDQVPQRNRSGARLLHCDAGCAHVDPIDDDVGGGHEPTATWIWSVKCSVSVTIDEAQRCASTSASNPWTPGARVAVSRCTISTCPSET